MDAYENGNASAHPTPHVWAERWEMIEKIRESEGGLTKRELFAAMALQGFMANKEHARYFDPDEDAMYAVRIADCLLRALEKNP
ncbi:hypothetical protein [Stenotrophomonas maltophilia]|uniref:hypothetical protein n=1 Tax=Stenotrophomonas maltophilia TaxID=40324 RepID=UPI0015DDCC1E|nr:hypothetical protein [Stenotrophomonas maltophilia]MBA0362401.1 hypothetical protein [Stenotrophomonas maltophilia]